MTDDEKLAPLPSLLLCIPLRPRASFIPPAPWTEAAVGGLMEAERRAAKDVVFGDLDRAQAV